MNRLLIGLVIILICSIIANVLVFSFYFDKYSTSELFERFLNKNIEEELQLPKIPEIYQENILVLNFEKNVKKLICLNRKNLLFNVIFFFENTRML